jgi:purine-binding chemotaxis protein CheW
MSSNPSFRPATSAVTSLQLVRFSIGSSDYALEIPQVREVVRLKNVKALPDGPAFIEGIINLRGEAVPVVDLRGRFDASPDLTDEGREACIVVAQRRKRAIGFLVDRVHEVLFLDARQLQPAPADPTSEVGRYLRAVVHVDGRDLHLLDPEQLLSTGEWVEVATLVR